MVAGLKERTGRSLDQWIELIRTEGPEAATDRVAWLKSDHGMGTNYAGVLALAAAGQGRERWDPEAYLAAAPGYVEMMFSGKREALLPVCEALLAAGRDLGDDVRVSPTTTLVSLCRRHVFAQIKPTTQTRLDLGLALGDMVAEEPLIDTGGLARGDRITHRIALGTPADIDAFVGRWLREAYERAG